MKEVIKRYYRDVLTGVLMTLSLALTFFLVINGIRLIGMMEQEDKIDGYAEELYGVIDSIAEITDWDIKCEFYNSLDSINMFELLKTDACNVSFYNSAFIPGATDGNGVVQYVVSCNEDFSRKIIEGEMPKDDFSNGCVLISETAKKAVEIKDGESYIEIDGYMYKVSGVVRDVTMSQSEEEYILFADAMTREQKDKIEEKLTEHRCMLHIGSSEGKVMEVFRDISGKLSSYEAKIDAREGIGHSQMEMYTRDVNKIIQPVMIFFSFLNVFVVTGIWVRRRLKECAIRKSFGATYGMLMTHLMKEMSKCVAVSFVLGVIMQIIYGKVTGQIFDAVIYFNTTTVKILAVVFVIIAGILCFYGSLVKKTENITAIHTM